MTLRHLVERIENESDELVIFATKDKGVWEIEGPAALVLRSDAEKIGVDLEELNYFLEIEIAKDVLDVWKQWRGGRIPTENEKCEALIYYADNDAYLEN